MTPIALLGLALGLGAPALKERPAPEASIRGEWQVTKRFDRGRPSEDRNHWTFGADGNAEIRNPSGQIASTLTYTVSVDGKLKTLDFHESQANGRAELRQAIYRIVGDTMTISWTLGGTPRPTSVDPATGHDTVILERVRPKN